MVASINASTSAGVVTTADTSGVLALQTAGTTALSISASQVVTLTNALPVASGGSGVTTSTGTGANVLGTSPTITTPTISGDATISGLTVGKGGGAVANNTAVGVSVLANHTSNGGNVGVGYQALISNTTGFAQTAVGRAALYANTTGAYNVAVGAEALNVNTTASNNTAVGYGGLQYNITGTGNSALGYRAGWGITSNYNTAIGMDSMSNASGGVGLTSSANNTAVGYQTFYNLTSGGSNTAVGYQAGYSSTTSTTNTFIGVQAGYYNTTGNSNVMIGSQAGALSVNATTGDANIYIGGGVRGSGATNNNEIVIGYLTTGKGSQTGFINPNGSGVFQGNNSASWSTTSDRRLKKNIVNNSDGLNKITAIQVRNFEYRLPEEVDPELKPADAVPNTGVQLGVIAQELQAVLPDCVKAESTGVLSVDPDNLTWYMVNAIKDLKTLNDTQAETINALTARIVALEGV